MNNSNWLEEELATIEELKEEINVSSSIKRREVLRGIFEELGFNGFNDTTQGVPGEYTYLRGELILSKYNFKLICLLGNKDIYIGLCELNDNKEKEIIVINDYWLSHVASGKDDLKILIKNKVLQYLNDTKKLKYNAICMYSDNCSLKDRYYE